VGEVDFGGNNIISFLYVDNMLLRLSFENAFLNKKFLLIVDVFGLEYFAIRYFLIVFSSKTFYSYFSCSYP